MAWTDVGLREDGVECVGEMLSMCVYTRYLADTGITILNCIIALSFCLFIFTSVHVPYKLLDYQVPTHIYAYMRIKDSANSNDNRKH